MIKKRESKFEVIRIISMFLIVLDHSIYHGIFDNYSISIISEYPVNVYFMYILSSFGKVGVYLFVLITGYFMCNSTISIKKIVKLWFPVFFWSVILTVIFGYSLKNIVGGKSLIKSFLPILSNQYWFVTVYIFMYLLIPVLNLICNWLINCKKEKYFFVISILLIAGNCSKFMGGAAQIGSMLLVFCVIYLIGALIRKKSILNNTLVNQINPYVFVCCFLLLASVIAIIMFALNKHFSLTLFKLMRGILYNPWTFIGILEAISLFIIIGSSKIQYNRLINRIASTAFGIYLISDNNYVRSVIWNDIFHMDDIVTWNPFLMILAIVITTIIVYIVSGILEWTRQIIFEKFENKISDFVQQKFDSLIVKK